MCWISGPGHVVFCVYALLWGAAVVVSHSHHVPDHNIVLINLLSQRLVDQDSSVPYDDACFTLHTVTQEKTHVFTQLFVYLDWTFILFLLSKKSCKQQKTCVWTRIRPKKRFMALSSKRRSFSYANYTVYSKYTVFVIMSSLLLTASLCTFQETNWGVNKGQSVTLWFLLRFQCCAVDCNMCPVFSLRCLNPGGKINTFLIV